MKHLNTTMIMVASLVLTVLLGVAGCGGDRRDHHRVERNSPPERYESRDNDRHEDRGGDSDRTRDEHGDRH